jgi:hypothetical protein
VRVVRGAVEWIEDPAPARERARGRTRPELLCQHVVSGKTLGDDLPAHAFTLEIHFGDEVDFPFFRHAKSGGLPGELNLAGSRYDVDGCLEKLGHVRCSIFDFQFGFEKSKLKIKFENQIEN